MAWFIIFGTFAAWGVLSAVWAALGWLLPKDGGTLVWICSDGDDPEGILLRLRWLRGLGVIHGPLLLAGSQLSPEERKIWAKKYPGVEFCSLEEVSARLEAEREQLD